MPRVIPPLNDNEEWLLWFQVRDDTIPSNVVQLSTGLLMIMMMMIIMTIVVMMIMMMTTIILMRAD